MTLIRRYPLAAFFVFAYALSWILWIPVATAGLNYNAPDRVLDPETLEAIRTWLRR